MIEAERIVQDLAETRARMDRRLDELQDRLSPSQIVNEAFAYLQGSGGADVARNLIIRVRDNPIPFALTAVGIGWLMASGRHRNGTHERSGFEVGASGTGGESFDGHDTARKAQPLGDSAPHVGGVKDKLASATRTMREAARDLQAGAADIASRWSNASIRHASTLREGSQIMYGSTRDRFRSATSNPLAIGALAIVAGIVAGAVIPITQEEESMLGSAAGRVREAGRGLVQDVVDRGADAAKDVVAAVKDSAEAHGLARGKLTDEPIMASQSADIPNLNVAAQASQPGQESVGTSVRGDLTSV